MAEVTKLDNEPSTFTLPSPALKKKLYRAAQKVGIADRQHFASGWAQRKQSRYETRFEAQIGSSNFLPFGVLNRAATLGRAVCKINATGQNYRGDFGAWSGTGFIVGPGLLLTNHHVLNSFETAEDATVIFDYLDDGTNGPTPNAPEATLNPSSLFITSPATGGLDYTFVAIGKIPGDIRPILMHRGAFATDFMKRANIIQHPDGRPKEVVLQDNQVLPDDHPLFLHYVTDTQGGASGAPVFDNNWELKALHHASRKNLEGELPIGTDGTPPERLNEGVKISAIAADLELRLESSEIERAAATRILEEIRGEDSFTGYFGVRGRGAGLHRDDGLEAVINTYYGKEHDIDVAFWNVEWFNREYEKKIKQVAGLVADLNVDVWAFSESSPEATEALVAHMHQEFGQRFGWAASEPDASSGKQTTTVMWNRETVTCTPTDWPAEIVDAFGAHSKEFDDIEMEAVEGKIFNRFPGLFHIEAKTRTRGAATFDFFLVPLHLKAKAEGSKRRQMASELLARAIDIMTKDGHDKDWVLGGDFNAELKSGDFDPLKLGGFTAMSARDEEQGAFSYLSPRYRSLIDHIFLSPNMSERNTEDGFFILAADKKHSNFAEDMSDHRPVIARLSLDSAAVAAGSAAEHEIAALVRSFQDNPAQLLREIAEEFDRQSPARSGTG